MAIAQLRPDYPGRPRPSHGIPAGMGTFSLSTGLGLHKRPDFARRTACTGSCGGRPARRHRERIHMEHTLIRAGVIPATEPREAHRTGRIGWLRAAVLGADDGIISIASLMVGVAAAPSTMRDVIIAGVAGTVAGAISMAAGEYVSVSSQADTESAEIARERRELAENPEYELAELTAIYEARGLDPDLARRAAAALMAKDALGAHVRDELGLSDVLSANPAQAAVASALSFAAGAALPLLVAVLAPSPRTVPAIIATSLVCLAALGSVSAMAGGAAPVRAAMRVTFWGALAMALTAGAGWAFGLTV